MQPDLDQHMAAVAAAAVIQQTAQSKLAAAQAAQQKLQSAQAAVTSTCLQCHPNNLIL